MVAKGGKESCVVCMIYPPAMRTKYRFSVGCIATKAYLNIHDIYLNNAYSNMASQCTTTCCVTYTAVAVNKEIHQVTRNKIFMQ